MVNFLLPITFFSKMYTYSLAEPLTMVAFPFFVMVIMIQLYRFPERIKLIIPKNSALILAAFFWLIQLVVMLVSYNSIGESKVTWGLLHSPITLAGWTAALYIAWALIQVTIISEKDEKRFIKSGLIGLALYLGLVILPQLLVTFHVSSLTDYVDGLAGIFESHWKSYTGYNFYSNGSYVTTLHRVNGFEPEASYLANLLSIVYLPILIGITTTGQKIWSKFSNPKEQLTVNTVFTFIVLSVLIFAKTTTGILAAFVGYSLWVLWSQGKLRSAILWIASLGIVLLILGYFNVQAIQNMLNQFLFAKQGTDNRLGGTIALAITFLTHPLFGVGTGFTSYYTILHFPMSASQNFEFQHVYSQYGFPILSEFLGWLASFGLVIMIPAFWLLGRLIARSFLIQNKLRLSNNTSVDESWSRSLHISFITMIVLIAFSSIFIIRVYLWPYLLMFFFYRKHIIRLEKELK